jgi:LVIVD repeat
MKRFAPLLLLFMAGCIPDNTTPGLIRGYAPVYASANTIETIDIQTAKATASAGKIYAYGNYAFQVDQYQGIHIIADAQSAQAHKIAFLKVPLSTEIAIKNDYLYTNNLNDLVVFNINNPAQPQLVHRLKDAFPAISQDYPPFSNVYFECPDPSKGIVIRWEEKEIKNPECRR